MSLQMTKEKSVVISFRVSEDEKWVIEDLIQKSGLSKSNLIRECVNLYIEKMEEENGSN